MKSHEAIDLVITGALTPAQAYEALMGEDGHTPDDPRTPEDRLRISRTSTAYAGYARPSDKPDFDKDEDGKHPSQPAVGEHPAHEAEVDEFSMHGLGSPSPVPSPFPTPAYSPGGNSASESEEFPEGMDTSPSPSINPLWLSDEAQWEGESPTPSPASANLSTYRNPTPSPSPKK